MNLLTALGARIRGAHPDHQAIFRGMAWISLFVVVGKIMGAAKEMAVAFRYGVSAEVDAYAFVFYFVSWIVGLWFAVLTAVLVPLAARLRQDVLGDLPRFRAELLGVTLILGVAAMALAWAVLSLMLRLQWTGLAPNTVEIAAQIIPSQVLLVPLGALISLFSAWMLAGGRHANTLLEGVPALVMITAILLVPGGGVATLVWGTIAGFAVQLLCLGGLLIKSREVEAPRFSRRSPQWAAFWNGFGVLLAGQGLMTFIGFVDLFYAARLDTGAVAILSYVNRIMFVVIGLGATVATRALLPVFSGAGAKDPDRLHAVALHWVRLLFMVGVLAAVVGWWLAPSAVRLLFERGEFFAHDTQNVTEVLRYGLAQLPFYFAGLVFASYASSRGAYNLLCWSGVIAFFVKLLANTVLVSFFGLKGLALGWVLVYASTALYFWLTLRRR